MSVIQVSWPDKIRGVAQYIKARINGRPLGVTLELTRRCNAKCDYCDHWREPKRKELDTDGFVDVVRHFDPLAVTVCGGEPLIRKDAVEIVRRSKKLPGYRYVAIITNGWFMLEPKAQELLDAGIDQFNISLNFPDERQDEDRKLRGLYDRIAHIVPWLTRQGAHVQLNTILMQDNLDDVLDIVNLADDWGAKVLLTLYSELPAGNRRHLFAPEMRERVRDLCAELLSIQRTRGIIANEAWYLEHVPVFVDGAQIGGCTAGKQTIHVTPEGLVRACAELPPISHYKDYSVREQPWTDCTACFQACRGESQAPITVARIIDHLRS